MEEYRNVKGYEGIYQVSNLGNVRRVYRKKKGFGQLKPVEHSGGYYRLKLRNKGNDKDVYIHRLVAEAFLSGDGNEVNHKDGNRKNNTTSNLEWCNRHENNTHSKKYKKTSSIFAGVDASRNQWRSRLMVNGVRTEIGRFKCETSAHFAYLKELKKQNIKNKYA